MSSQAPLTAKELAELDAADGVIDGKIHGVDASKFVHDKTKSTREGEWEFRDGKYYRRDYYASTVEAPPKIEPKVEDPRDRIIAELKRMLNEKDLLIQELRTLLESRDREIVTLRQKIHTLQLTVERLEIEIRECRTRIETREVIVAPPPVSAEKSYYVVRSQFGQNLLAQYGKQDVVIQPEVPIVVPPPIMAPPPLMAPPLIAPPIVAYDVAPMIAPMPMIHATQQFTSLSQYTPVQPTQHHIREEVHVQEHRSAPSTAQVNVTGSQREFYRVDDEAMRRKLDMMDGVADGKLHGHDIFLKGESTAGAQVTATAHSSHVIHNASSGGLRSSENAYYRVDDDAMRHKLDMMDGKADGKFHGTDIQVRGGVRR